MEQTDIPLFALADRRLAWLDQRLSALAGNVANADTPGFIPRDVTPFAAMLAGSVGGALVAANDGERAPDGNGVSLDVEMLRLSRTDADNELVQQVYKKFLGLLRAAAGR